MKKILFLIAIALVAMSACKKNKANPVSLVNKWEIVNTHAIQISNGLVVYEDMYTGVAGDYLDFKSDNKMYSSVDGTTDVTPYQLVGSDKLVIDGDTFLIQSLTASSVTLYLRDPATGNSYTEITINLKR